MRLTCIRHFTAISAKLRRNPGFDAALSDMRLAGTTASHDDVSAWRPLDRGEGDASARPAPLGRQELGKYVPDANGRVLCDSALRQGRIIALPSRPRDDRILD